MVALLLACGAEAQTDAKNRETLLVAAAPFVTGDLKLASVTFIDVRDPGIYRQARIPGSISTPLYTLKTKTYLKDKKVVIVDEGLASERSVRECARLREMGFKDLTLLKDGLRGWRKAGGAIEGERAAGAAVGTITVADFHEAGRQPGWLLVDARSDAQVKSGEKLAGSFRRISPSGKPSAFADKLKALMAKNKSAARALILTSSGDGYDELEPEVRKLGGAPVFYLSGGVEAYARHLALEANLKNRREVKLADNSLSGTRGGAGYGRGGCGSCP